MARMYSGCSGHLLLIADMSLIGGNFAPYRLPADSIPFFCAEYGHETGDVKRTSYAYSAQVPNYDASVGGTIAPYTRYQDTHSSGSCDAHINCPTLTNGIPCTSWIPVGGVIDETTVSRQYTLVGGLSQTAPQAFTAGANVNFAVCHKQGFKSVAAKRVWHGNFGWLSPNITNQYCPQSGGGICDVANPQIYDPVALLEYIPYASSPDQVKYCTITPSVTYSLATAVWSGGSTLSTGSTSGSTTINKQSGEVTSTLVTTEYDTAKDSGGTTTVTHNISKGVDTAVTPNTYFNETVVDIYAAADAHDGNNVFLGGTLDSSIDAFNTLICTALNDAAGGGNAVSSYSMLPPYTDKNNYSTQTGSLVIVENAVTGKTLTYGLTIGWSRTNTTYTFSLHNTVTWSSQDSSDNNNTDLTVSGSITLSNPNTASDVYGDLCGNLLSTWPLNDDALYPWRTDGSTTMVPKVSRLEWGAEVSLWDYTIGPNSGFGHSVDDYENPIADSDGNSPFSTGWLPTWSQRSWFDPRMYAWAFPPGKDQTTAAATALVKIYDGSIQGAPNPAGYQGYFRYDALDMQACCDSGGVVWYTYGYGQSLPTELPQNATQWTNFFEIINKPSMGALVAYGDASTVGTSGGCFYEGIADAGFWAVKWAEIGETYESINFARPGGADKFLCDETTVYCYSGGILYQQDGTTPATGLSLTGIWGGACVSGFFNGASTNGSGTVSLGTQAFNVPSDWTNGSGDQASAFGKLRFSTAPSILGRVVVTAIADASSHAPFSVGWTPTYQFLSAQTSFGMKWSGGSYVATDTVDLYDQTMTLVASGITATRLTDSTFTVTTAYPTAHFVMIHGAPAYQYCDNYPKGDFTVLEWLYDFRTNGEIGRLSGVTDCGGHTPPSGSPTTTNSGFSSFTETAAALPLMPCHPRVACFSPNGETWPNGTTFAFPGSFVADYTYGAKWQAQVVWSITDPLYQKPHTPCGLTDAWAMDDGSCIPDDPGTVQYYALEPMVEARITVPSGFPALPTGITLGFTAPGTTGGTYPPDPTGYDGSTGIPNNTNGPWQVAQNLCASIEGGCIFDYQNWFIECPS